MTLNNVCMYLIKSIALNISKLYIYHVLLKNNVMVSYMKQLKSILTTFPGVSFYLQLDIIHHTRF